MDKMVLKKIITLTIAVFMYNINYAQVNFKAPVVSIDSIEIDAPIAIVWETLYDIKTWNKKFDFIEKTTVEDSTIVGTKFQWKTTKLKINSKVLIVNIQKQFCWTGTKYGVKVFHNWLLKQLPNGKVLLISQESQQGLFASLFKNKFNNSVKQGSIKWLKQIKNYAESIENVKQNK